MYIALIKRQVILIEQWFLPRPKNKIYNIDQTAEGKASVYYRKMTAFIFERMD